MPRRSYDAVMRIICKTFLWAALAGGAAPAMAGGGMILSEDKCIVEIDFYQAHFTAYQPEASGDSQYCKDLPSVGETIFVLDYLHRSLSEVPVDFRIIRDVTGKGEFVKIDDIEAIGDLGDITVFYHPPEIKSNATYSVTHTFAEKGDYVGIVTAGHPTNDSIYTSVFPLTVGASSIPWPMIAFVAALLIVGSYLGRMKGIGGRTERA